MNKYFRLTHAVLASTLLCVPTVYADVTISTPMTNQDIQTAVSGNVTITRNGQLSMTLAAPNAGDAILVNSNDATVTIDAANVNAGGNAVVTSGAGRYGINITGQDATITLGAQSGITSGTDDAIFIDGTGTTLSSTGEIFGNASAIEITNNGTNAIISLLAGSTTEGTTAASILVNGTGLSFGNAGTVTASGGQDAVQLLQNFTNFQNNIGGIIEVTAGVGNAVTLNNAAGVSGDLNNRGTLTTAGTGSALNILNTFNGSINNNSTGVISSTGGGGNAIYVAAGFSQINNTGIISGLANDIAIQVGANAAGTINNDGTISAQNNYAIRLGGNITGILNTGTISNNAPGQATIGVIFPGTDLINGITNRGNITNLGGATAIDLSLGDNIVFTQAAGTVTGDVFLAGAGGNIFSLTGGTIIGDVTADDAAANILTLSGGSITGTLFLGDSGDTVNLSGSIVDTIVAGALADTFNVSGGTITTALLNGGAGDQLNINGSFTMQGIIVGIPTINVNTGTFTADNAITGLNTLLNISAGSVMIANADITGTANMTNNGRFQVLNDSTTDLTGGTITNNGTVAIDGGSTLLATTFHQTAGSVFAPVITAPGDFGVLQVGGGGATLDAGSVIYPYYNSGSFIPAGTQFNVITGGPVIDNATLAQPSSVSLFFTQNVVGGNILQLTAERRPYAAIVQGVPPPMEGIAIALDAIAAAGTNDPTLQTVLGQLDSLTSASALENALINLSPNVNYALIQSTHSAVNELFNSIEFRIESLKNLKPLGAEGYSIYRPEPYYTGKNYGDCCDDQNTITGIWFDVYGSLLNQKFYKNVNGYYGDLVGYALGADWGRPETIIAGAALSYTNTHTVGNSEQANILDTQSVQGTFYAWYEPCEAVFLDILFGFSGNKYYSRRNIGVGTFNTAAFATFYGFEYAVQTDLGYAFTYDYLVVAPVGRFKYSYLQVNSYTEEGAAGVDLSVSTNSVKELIGGGGLKLLGSKKFSQATYVPEFSALILYDFYGDGQELNSNFFGGGPLFPTDGPRPSHTIYLYSLGVTAYTNDHYSFEVRYDLEIRDRYHFYGNSGFMQLRGEWG